MEETDRICLIDMDGTLFGYEERLRSELQKIQSVYEPPVQDIENLWDAEQFPWLRARMELIKNSEGFWRDLPKIGLGWDILDICQQIGFECQILTKGPKRISAAWKEKVECIQHHFPGMTINIVGKDKKGVYGRVLVDDYPEYVEGWLKHRPRGLAVMPKQHYNADYKHANCIVYDGTNQDKLRQALRAAYVRSPHQHWRDIIL